MTNMMVVQHLHNGRDVFVFANDGYGMSITMSSYCLYLCFASTLEEAHITIADVEAMILHGVAAHCNRILNWIVPVITCKFSLRISMNYTQLVVNYVLPV